MAKNDPEQVEAGAGLLMSVITKLNRAVLKRTNGKPGAFHHLSTPDGDALIEQMADIIVVGLDETFTFDVDFDDPEWDRIDRDKCVYVGDIQASDYPRKYLGKKRITARLQKFDHDAPDQELFHLTNCQNEQLPDRAITQTFGRKFPNEQKQAPVIGICGGPEQRSGDRNLSLVSLSSGGVRLGWYWTEFQWLQYCRVLVVCKVEDMIVPK